MNVIKPKFWDHPGITFWSIILYPFSILFLLVSSITKFFRIQKKFQIPIICVGNIYIGGTGKTPLASEIFKIVHSIGKNPGFVKKYYNYLEDEIKMLENIGKTFVKKNRKQAINLLIKNGHDLAILDDGFQDFSIKKDFSILCFNSKQWIGNGFIIPSGPLRESVKSIARADCIVMNGHRNITIEDQINKINKNVKIFYSKYKIMNLDKFKNKKIIAFAGIGNPSNFFELLKENNIDVIKTYSFPDHHNYSKKQLENIIKDFPEGVSKIVTTEKDYSRMKQELISNCDYVKVNLEIENKDEFINLIKSKI